MGWEKSKGDYLGWEGDRFEGPMKVLRVSFVGIRSRHFGATVGMFRDVLGMEVAFENPGWAGFSLPSGDRDLLELIGELVWASDISGSPADEGWGWCFFRAPDGNVYVLQQDGAGRGD